MRIDRSAAERPGADFPGLTDQAADSLLALIALHRQDPRPGKIDLGVGVYRDEGGATPVLRAVKAAERQLLDTQDTKSYLGAEGDGRFVDLLAEIPFGVERARDPRLTGLQTPGGTGALRLAGELIAAGLPRTTIWVGIPTWPNHIPIFEAAGLEVRTHPFFDVARQEIEFDAMIGALGAARPGDVVLLHGGCHNPAGAAFNPEQWSRLAALVAANGLVPLVDVAYQGLGRGLEPDATGTRLLLDSVESVIVAYSCDKNFGLYRERTGALWVRASAEALVPRIRANLLALARANWSMPPDHGAAVVRIILESAELSQQWRAELEAMRRRLVDMRTALAAGDPRLASLARQEGMFSMLPIARAGIEALREQHGVYMAPSGRLNIAGLNRANLDTFVAAVREHL